MQGFDWNSSKMFDEYNNYVATTEETTEKDTSSGTETGKHMSYWRWLTSRVASIAKLGVTHVWLPPPLAKRVTGRVPSGTVVQPGFELVRHEG